MREIKFRAWAIEDKKFIDPNSVYVNGNGDLLSYGSRDDTGGFNQVVVIQQSTGLKDKNGKEIWEGDIVTGHTSYESNNDEMEWTREKPRVVEWNETEAGFRPFTYNNRWRCDVVNIEVIGNIYEHPNLLQEEKGDRND